MAEIDSLPYSEFCEHLNFWREYRWGMTDDLHAMSLAHQMKVSNPKSSATPWMIKSWTLQKDYTYRLSRLVTKPVAAIRSGFFAIVAAVKGMKNGGKHQ